jgi:Rhodopirellula transposase DDE domain
MHGFPRRAIGNTTTKTGLTVVCRIDDKLYPKGVTVSDAELEAINLAPDDFHGEWNYTISPSINPRSRKLRIVKR